MPNKNSLALIGPAKSGKSAVGPLLAARMGLPFQSHDITGLARVHERYDDTQAHDVYSLDGISAWYRYQLPLGVDVLRQTLADIEPCVVEIAKWYPHPDDALFEHIRAALSSLEHVVMLRPAEDVDRACRIIEERRTVLVDGIDMNAHFLQHRSNYELAKHVVYTKGRTVTETRDEILSRVDPGLGALILIGPMRAGKSTQGLLVSEALGRTRVAMDAVRWDYYKEIGWSVDRQNEIWKTEGLGAVLRYWKPFEIHAVERLLADYPDCVIDFGAGHSVYEDEALLARQGRSRPCRQRRVVIAERGPGRVVCDSP
jgi:shikimate kinase